MFCRRWFFIWLEFAIRLLYFGVWCIGFLCLGLDCDFVSDFVLCCIMWCLSRLVIVGYICVVMRGVWCCGWAVGGLLRLVVWLWLLGLVTDCVCCFMVCDLSLV